MAWTEFRKGKRSKFDVQAFELHLEDNIFALHEELKSGAYCHGGYHQFRISDPRPRLISKALVRDRLLHHAIYRILYPAFDRTFIFDSYSCRKNKGTHKGFFRLVEMARRVSRNYTSPCWALKLDIRKFFDSVNHEMLMELLRARISDERLLGLLENIVFSFLCCHPRLDWGSRQKHQKVSFSYLDSRLRGNDRGGSGDDKGESGNDGSDKGMPLGNLTSQLFANIYLDSLDKFVKHRLKAKYYLRYADDFILLSSSPDEILGYFIEINKFLKNELKLSLHPNKILLRKLSWGIDFVGYNALPRYNLPRKRTVSRLFQRLRQTLGEDPDKVSTSLQSCLGYLKHVNAHKISQSLRNPLNGLKKISH